MGKRERRNGGPVSAFAIFSHDWRLWSVPRWLPWWIAVRLDRHRHTCKRCGCSWKAVAYFEWYCAEEAT